MDEFTLHRYSRMAYESKQIITFSGDPSMSLPDVDREMEFHKGVKAVQISNLTQKEFDYFIKKYGDEFEAIYFFQNTKVRDLTALAKLREIQYLLFYNVRGNALWDMRNNLNLKGIMIFSCKKMLSDLEQLQLAPNLEELILCSATFGKYTVKTAEPLKNCKKLKRLFIDFNTEDKRFCPEDFQRLDVFQYQCDRKRNFSY